MSESKETESKPIMWLWSQYFLDAFSWIVAILLALLLRYELDVNRISWLAALSVMGVAVLTQVIAGYSFSLYRGRYSFGSFQEARLLVIVTLIVAVTTSLYLFIFINQTGIGRSVGAIAFPFACMFMAAIRYLKRLYVEGKPRPGEQAQRTLVYGAGFLGNSLVNRMLQDTQSPFFPVGLVDDDPAKKHLHLSSVSVLGRGDDLAEIAKRTHAEILVLAFAKVESAKVREISEMVAGLRLRVLVLPPLQKMLDGGISDFREIAVEDLIGRRPVDIQVEKIAGYVTGKRVLVTGAGGSIGSELCRQLVGFDPSELMMLDRDESGLQATQLSISGHGLLNGRDTILADIRDENAIREIFLDRRPEVVFHASALKHAPLLQQYPQEAWKTNVVGTLNVLQAARDADVQTLVNISTDKAANPTTALGHSKRVAEKLTAWMAQQTGKTYVSVRFGNVIGSRGSMLPLFSEQIRTGGPLTVTHPDVTRFFMTIPEACQLVIQAGAIGTGGEVLLLDIGEPVRILDVAKQMIAMSGKDIEIVFTGLRPSEKLHEVLVGYDEVGARPLHPKISHTRAKPLNPQLMDYASWLLRSQEEAGEPAFELEGDVEPFGSMSKGA
ncbi:UDP-N-acetylglucosamine 4,6-dehydratase [Renibacterium salmoninarum ATCC 33209]|uniref:UDP-N-acetylglucosamine 4,6-dehydratase n=2 Tax=Renibacterium salmoninarum TaxID=1646 RepID=A9WNB8_RENSM|nr:nucleoside-diphosphate sugar epimerase/dehydratase [Renibacterium salmoninarum]ABY23174.1 UDP-N-acetylglucosamine 4,6-dehydratase [Renibacterium salmoninarum ATCC 33209]